MYVTCDGFDQIISEVAMVNSRQEKKAIITAHNYSMLYRIVCYAEHASKNMLP